MIKKRLQNARLYENELKNLKKFIVTPQSQRHKCNHTFHRYIVFCNRRNELLNFLIKKNIEAKIHYPINIHEQLPFKKFYKNNLTTTNKLNNKILSLPIQEFLKKREIMKICFYINQFYKKK